MALADNARKEAQIKEINRLGRIADALVEFAMGDETALARITAPPVPAPKIAIESTQPAPATDVCECQVPVKEKNGSQACMLCGKNARDRKYIFSHTPEGKALLQTKTSGFISNTSTGETVVFRPATEFVPCAPPPVFKPASPEDHGEDES